MLIMFFLETSWDLKLSHNSSVFLPPPSKAQEPPFKMLWTEICPSPKSYAKALSPNVIVYGAWVFREVIKVKSGRKCGALIQYD